MEVWKPPSQPPDDVAEWGNDRKFTRPLPVETVLPEGLDVLERVKLEGGN